MLDRTANAITDAMNEAIPWLWWPLAVPHRDAPLPTAAHALYAVHGLVLLRASRAAGRPVGPRTAVVAGLASWWWFTAAWNRRARAGLRGATGR